MMFRSLFLGLLIVCSIHGQNAVALSTEQLFKICASASVPCADVPVVQAYLGGALDLLATLDEETTYLDKVYCAKPEDVFDIPAIVEFMESHQEGYAQKNAMLLLVRFFEANGGCNAESSGSR